MSVQQVDASELFNLLESNDLQTVEEIKNLIHDNLNSSKEAWLLNGLVDYHNACDSDRARDILCGIREPHDKHLFEKLHECIKTPHTRLPSLNILGHIVVKQPSWLHRIVKDPLFGLLIKRLKHENDVPTINSTLLILCTILPMIPEGIIPYLDSMFDVFNRLAAFSTKKPGNVPQVFLLHLNVGVYSFFHRLYGMYPCRFLDYLKHHYSKRENKEVFDDCIKPLLERIRLHPLLILSSKEREATAERWRKLETQDIIIECARMSLDPVEGVRGEMIGRRQHSLESYRDSSLSHLFQDESNTQSQVWTGDQSQVSSNSYLNTFWSPSVMCGLATPPPHDNMSGLHVSLTGQTSMTPRTPQTPQAGMTSTPAPSPWETTPRDSPPVHDTEQFERSGQGGVMSNRSSNRSLQSFSSRAASDNRPPPITGIKNTSPYVPEVCDALYSPMKREFTNERPSLFVQRPGSKSTDASSCSVSPLVKPTAIRKINLAEFDEAEQEISTSNLHQDSKQNSVESASDVLTESVDKSSVDETPDSEDSVQTPSTLVDFKSGLSQTERLLLEKLQKSGYEIRPSAGEATANSSLSTSDVPPLHIQSLPQIIEQFSESSSIDNNDDREICDINQVSARSRHASNTSSQSSVMDATSGVMTAESVAQFMKNVNRIRFNSMTIKDSQELRPALSNSSRAQSCPAFETEDEAIPAEVESINEEEVDQVDVTYPATHNTDTVTRTVTSVVDSPSTNTRKDVEMSTPSTIPPHPSTLLPRMTRSLDWGNFQPNCCSRPQSCICRPPSSMLEEDMAKYPYAHLIPYAMPYLPIAECQKCLDHSYVSPAESRSATGATSQPSHMTIPSSSSGCLGTETPLFTTFSPSEILDRHIACGGDVHAKELSKLPLTSQDAINWTHFGGVPPSDEINILKGQIHLLHNQLMYERHKREMHSRRNRRLLSKVVKTASLEEQKAAMLDQLKLQEEEIQNMKVSLKLGQEQHRQLQEQKSSNEYQREVQLSALAKENKDLKYNNGELKKLLVSHKEENDRLNKSLASYKDRVFRLQQELYIAHKQVALTDQLKGQVKDLTKKVIVQGEIHKKYQEKIRRLQVSHNPKPEAESMIAHLKEELYEVTQLLNQKQSEAESLGSQLTEQHDIMRTRDLLICQQKRELEILKVEHSGQAEALESKYSTMKAINETLEAHILQLQEEIHLLTTAPKPGTKIDSCDGKSRRSHSPRSASQSPTLSPEQPAFERQSPARSLATKSLDSNQSSETGVIEQSSLCEGAGGHSSTPYQPTPYGTLPDYTDSLRLDEDQLRNIRQQSADRCVSELTDSVTLMDSGYGQ